MLQIQIIFQLKIGLHHRKKWVNMRNVLPTVCKQWRPGLIWNVCQQEPIRSGYIDHMLTPHDHVLARTNQIGCNRSRAYLKTCPVWTRPLGRRQAESEPGRVVIGTFSNPARCICSLLMPILAILTQYSCIKTIIYYHIRIMNRLWAEYVVP